MEYFLGAGTGTLNPERRSVRAITPGLLISLTRSRVRELQYIPNVKPQRRGWGITFGAQRAESCTPI